MYAQIQPTLLSHWNWLQMTSNITWTSWTTWVANCNKVLTLVVEINTAHIFIFLQHDYHFVITSIFTIHHFFTLDYKFISSTKTHIVPTTECSQTTNRTDFTDHLIVFLISDAQRFSLHFTCTFIFTRTWPCYIRVFAMANPSVACNVRAPYSGDWNFRQYLFAILYVNHLLTSVQNFTEIVPGEPLSRGR